jgi:hypothetical protein
MSLAAGSTVFTARSAPPTATVRRASPALAIVLPLYSLCLHLNTVMLTVTLVTIYTVELFVLTVILSR